MRISMLRAALSLVFCFAVLSVFAGRGDAHEYGYGGYGYHYGYRAPYRNNYFGYWRDQGYGFQHNYGGSYHRGGYGRSYGYQHDYHYQAPHYRGRW